MLDVTEGTSSSGETAMMRQLRLPPTARPWRAASRTLCTRPPADRPTEAEVRKLAEGARLQQRMWDTFVPEGGIRFGDRRFWGLLGIVMALHAINTYREARKPLEPGLPEGGLRRLPDGRVLMLDGSIAKHESGLAHSLHKEPEKKELLLDRAYRMLKGSV